MSEKPLRNKEELIKHLQNLAIAVMNLTDEIKPSISNNEIIRQITRSCNSAAANYRATQRAKSTADFINKLKITEEETDETISFLEIIAIRISILADKANELIVEYKIMLAIIVKSIVSTKNNNK